MPQESARPINPVAEDFAGESCGRIAKRAFHATRPKFYPASVLPILAGTAWGVIVRCVGGVVFATMLVWVIIISICRQCAAGERAKPPDS